MKTATIREIKHDTSTVLGWVAHGETVEIRRRNQPIAMLTPLPVIKDVKCPDFEARLHSIYGDRVLEKSATDLISEIRGEF